MKIKLHAKLAAYSKFKDPGSVFPTPTLEDSGKLLGVDDQGQYKFMADATEQQINELFDSTKISRIDALFMED